jgi:hypothetical protein
LGWVLYIAGRNWQGIGFRLELPIVKSVATEAL